jgi:hypothetical protein
MKPKKRFKTPKDIERLQKKKLNLVIQHFNIKEIMDESGEVQNDTIIQISFEGILINLSVATAMKLARELSDTLEMR